MWRLTHGWCRPLFALDLLILLVWKVVRPDTKMITNDISVFKSFVINFLYLYGSAVKSVTLFSNVTVVTHQFFHGKWLCRSSHRTCLVHGRLSTITTHSGNPWHQASNWGRGSRDFICGTTGSGRRVNTDIGSVERTWFRSGSLWSDTLNIKMEV